MRRVHAHGGYASGFFNATPFFFFKVLSHSVPGVQLCTLKKLTYFTSFFMCSAEKRQESKEAMKS